ncbi:MAG TPA: NADH:ubiquinone reductase (Na(+)-transporting) subunit E [Lentisphaeria bacterium]|nr:NADH:ubiquinone reductase (Na(+)-transporting) subunit E [Lentisphaeria bacterium]
MGNHLNFIIEMIFVKNILLSFFLGMCTYLACSKQVSTAMDLGLAVIFVLTLATPLNWALGEFLLRDGALAWAGLPGVDLSFLNFIAFIAVIAAFVQIIEMFIEKFSAGLYNKLGVYLPLITVNCAILGASLFMWEREYTLVQSVEFGFASGLGWAIAIMALAAIRQKLRYSNIPVGLRGLGITMLVTGLISMAFMAFAGMNLAQ